MKFIPIDPAREFCVGGGGAITLKDCGRLELQPDEQVTFVTGTGAEYDVTRKSWGFYATPSMNGRLTRFGLRAVLVKSANKKLYVMLVERGKEPEFERYLAKEGLAVLRWFDTET